MNTAEVIIHEMQGYGIDQLDSSLFAGNRHVRESRSVIVHNRLDVLDAGFRSSHVTLLIIIR